MPILGRSVGAVVDSTLSKLPSRVRQRLIRSLSDHDGRDSTLDRARALGFRGTWTRDESDRAADGADLVRTLGEMLLRMKDHQRRVPSVHIPASDWASVLDAEWAEPRKGLDAGDFGAFEAFLRNFFRDGGISGLWGGRGMFEEFRTAPPWKAQERLELFMRQFNTWRREVPGGNLDDLDQPRVGNPWGYDMSGRLVVEPAFEYHSLALRIRDLVADVGQPVVMEIGGGFGGLARQILRLVPGVRYIGLDLPENVILQSWYLARSLPDRRIGFDNLDLANRDGLTTVDALILPNWALSGLQSLQIDLVVNVHSFGEMSRSTLDAYFTQLLRLRPEWIFHDNLGSPRRDHVYGIPATDYPQLHGYRLVSSCESRWPRYDRRSPYPCREFLFHRGRSASEMRC